MSAPSSHPPPLDAQALRGLGRSLEATQSEELDCEGFLAALPQLAELRLAGAAIPAELAPALAHERLCPNCREEAAALMDALG